MAITTVVLTAGVPAVLCLAGMEIYALLPYILGFVVLVSSPWLTRAERVWTVISVPIWLAISINHDSDCSYRGKVVSCQQHPIDYVLWAYLALPILITVFVGVRIHYRPFPIFRLAKATR